MDSDTQVISTQSFGWDTIRSFTMDNYLLQKEIEFIRESLKRHSPLQDCLEVGCGTGRLTLPLQPEQISTQMLGLDFDFVPLHLLSQQDDAVKLTQGDAVHLPFKDCSFDCIVAIQCLLDFDPFLFLQESHRILRKDGLLIFQFLNRNSYKWAFKQVMGLNQTWASHTSFLSYQQCLQATKGYGFTIETELGYNWLPMNRRSNSRAIHLFDWLERNIKLDSLIPFSPWILVAARKSS